MRVEDRGYASRGQGIETTLNYCMYILIRNKLRGARIGPGGLNSELETSRGHGLAGYKE